MRRLTISAISSSPFSVCWRSGKATLSYRFSEPNSAPSWKSTPNFLRSLNSSASVRLGIELAVDDHVALVRVQQPDDVLDADRLAGAGRADDHRDLALGEAHVQPAQDVVAPERLVDVDELDRVRGAVRADHPGVEAELLGSSSPGRLRGAPPSPSAQPPIGARALVPQKIWVPNASITFTSTRFSTIDFAVALPTPTGPPLAL